MDPALLKVQLKKAEEALNQDKFVECIEFTEKVQKTLTYIEKNSEMFTKQEYKSSFLSLLMKYHKITQEIHTKALQGKYQDVFIIKTEEQTYDKIYVEENLQIFNELVSTNDMLISFVVVIKNKFMEKLTWLVEVFQNIFSMMKFSNRANDDGANDDEVLKIIASEENETQSSWYWTGIKNAIKQSFGFLWKVVSEWTPVVISKVAASIHFIIRNMAQFVKFLATHPNICRMMVLVAKAARTAFCQWMSRQFGRVQYRVSTTAGDLKRKVYKSSMVTKDLLCLYMPLLVKQFLKNFPDIVASISPAIMPAINGALTYLTGGFTLVTGLMLPNVLTLVSEVFVSVLSDSFEQIFTGADVSQTILLAKKWLWDAPCVEDKELFIGTDISSRDFYALLQNKNSQDLRTKMLLEEIDYKVAKEDGRGESMLTWLISCSGDIPFLTEYLKDTDLLATTIIAYANSSRNELTTLNKNRKIIDNQNTSSKHDLDLTIKDNIISDDYNDKLIIRDRRMRMLISIAKDMNLSILSDLQNMRDVAFIPSLTQEEIRQQSGFSETFNKTKQLLNDLMLGNVQ